MKDNAVAYGSLYLDEGEDPFEVVDKQIVSFADQQKNKEISFVFFDIVGRREQATEVMAARAYAQQELMARLEKDLLQVYVATTFDDKQRPARELMMEYVK